MNHKTIDKATPEQIAVAEEAADWLLDAIATSTQDRRFLRGDPEYDDVSSESIRLNGVIACLRAMYNLEASI